MKSPVTLLAAIVCLAGAVCLAGMEMPIIEGSADLQRVKSLEGTWSGTTDMGEGEMEVVVTYKVSSNGSAVIETLNPGSPMEMVSVYHDQGGSLHMTHYCAIGNQPHMETTATDEDSITLTHDGSSGLKDANEMHMHGLVITFKDAHTIEHAWEHYNNGSSAGLRTFVLTRTP